MRVLIVMPWGQRLGGAENMLWLILRHIDRAVVEPAVVFFEEGAFERDVAALGIRTYVNPTGRLRQPVEMGRAIASMRRIMRRERPAVVLSWMAKGHLYAAPAAKAAGLGVPLLWWQHVVPDGHWLDRLASTLPTKAIGCSSHVGARAQHLIRPRRETFVVHPGIEIGDGNSISPDEAKAELGIPADRLVFGIVGRLQPLKGQDRFLRALSIARRNRPELHGVIVGGDAHGLSPDYARSIEALIGELELTDHVTMTGHVPDATSLLPAMDVLVNASDKENFSLALLEAMAAGVPPIAVSDGASGEMIEDGVSGVLVPRPEVELLAAAMERVAADATLRSRLADAARRRVASMFTAAHMADAVSQKLVSVGRAAGL